MTARFWDSLPPQERNTLREVARPRSFSPRQPLLNEGDDSDHVLLIMAGWAKVTSTTEDGHQMVMGVRGPGDLVGEDAALASQPRAATMWTLTSVRALAIPSVRFLAFLDSQPAAWRTLATTQIHRLAEAERRIKWQASGLDATQRLALLLTELADLSTPHSPPRPDGSIDIAPPLSQEELASWMDASRETVARALQSLRRRGLVRTGWRRLTVVPPHHPPAPRNSPLPARPPEPGRAGAS